MLRRLLALLVCGCIVACSGESERLKLATGPQGGAWYPLGGALKNAIERHVSSVTVQVLPGGGIANVKAVEQGQADVAFANSVSTVDAINGQPPFEEKATGVCNVATLYPQYFQVVTVASAGIRSPADFKGKALATQPRGNTGEAITAHLLQVYGMSYDDLSRVNYGSYTDSVTLLKDGNADIFTLGTAVPAGSVMDLASAREIRVIEIPDDALARMQAVNPGYQRIVIRAGTYPQQDQDVGTIGYATHLIVRCSLDGELVRGLLDSVFANLSNLSAVAKDMQHTTKASMGADIGVPMHPAAQQWYAEQSAG